MTTSNQMSESENTAHQPLPVDPFAVDFFGGKTSLAGDEELFEERENVASRRVARSRKKSDWYKKLPRLTNQEAEFSNLLTNLPENLTENAAQIIAATFARFTFREAENVKCELLPVFEASRDEIAARFSDAGRVLLTVGCQPVESFGFVVLSSDFSRSLIDSMLGGKGHNPDSAREISPIETTIIEFLAANVLSRINEFLGDSLLTLRAFQAGFQPQNSDSAERFVEMTFELQIDDLKGYVVFVAPSKFLNLLDSRQNALFLRKSSRKKLTDFEKFARAFELRLEVGTTFLDSESLLYLEPDDVVLIEKPQIWFENDGNSAVRQILVGRGKNVRLRGNIEQNGLNGNWDFQIGEILSEEARRRFTPAKFKMDEKENDLTETVALESVETAETEEETADEQISATLENVQVALRIEIAGNKISLRELQNLRGGQIIALGCGPTDPVRIVTDANEDPVALGELVEIEGQLGVRLTKVFI